MKSKSILQAKTLIEVQFYDVDAMRVVWHGNYVKYLEKARCELLQMFDYNYLDMEASGYIWPVVDMRIKYVQSAKLAKTIEVTASLVEYESRLKIEYVIRDVETDAVLTKAYTVQVAIDMQTEEMQYQSPQVVLDKLAAYI
ncbi:4-hydroxybenzoyl-CoA thioesterase [Catenovulum agarivorans DS-2]|uniref:4-hydroxybenzoyl-CoA thioesterase n=1 Tax=Catenovulum agarivorans DS-2 TaxID=1328313 RepID=W7QRZ5_9ALTE|nr:thioesterase family protein [Catenovulum agarivorans]EWH10613.1 4-hydroxybenzoyl-CoA thioesterase [Catenovulum agarivorans DS-2]